MRTFNGTRRGFTLLEILVVVLIISILATVVGVRLATQPGQARVAAATAQLVVFRQALSMYRMQSGQLPTVAQGLEALCERPSTPPVPAEYPAEGYLESPNLPDDPWGNPYVYLRPGPKNMPYDIITYGADAEPGGDGEDADLLLSEM